MNIDLPSVLADYFTATNAHDVAAMAASFAETATVHDEGGEHAGIAAIRAWMAKTIQKYDYQAEPIESSQSGSTVRVRVLVRGRFPGSPVTIPHAFTLAGQKIIRLEVGS